MGLKVRFGSGGLGVEDLEIGVLGLKVRFGSRGLVVEDLLIT